MARSMKAHYQLLAQSLAGAQWGAKKASCNVVLWIMSNNHPSHVRVHMQHCKARRVGQTQDGARCRLPVCGRDGEQSTGITH